jgi:hypothetical protein
MYILSRVGCITRQKLHAVLDVGNLLNIRSYTHTIYSLTITAIGIITNTSPAGVTAMHSIQLLIKHSLVTTNHKLSSIGAHCTLSYVSAPRTLSSHTTPPAFYTAPSPRVPSVVPCYVTVGRAATSPRGGRRSVDSLITSQWETLPRHRGGGGRSCAWPVTVRHRWWGRVCPA